MKLRINLKKSAAMLVHQWRYIGDEQRKRLYERAQDFLQLHYGELRITDFFSCMRCDFSAIGIEGTVWDKATQAQYIWAMGFADYMAEFGNMLERLTLKPTPEQRQAQGVCVSVSFEESVLVFCREYFGLSNFGAVGELTVNEYLIAKKDAYNKAAFERKLNEIYKLKQKVKK